MHRDRDSNAEEVNRRDSQMRERQRAQNRLAQRKLRLSRTRLLESTQQQTQHGSDPITNNATTSALKKSDIPSSQEKSLPMQNYKLQTPPIDHDSYLSDAQPQQTFIGLYEPSESNIINEYDVSIWNGEALSPLPTYPFAGQGTEAACMPLHPYPNISNSWQDRSLVVDDPHRQPSIWIIPSENHSISYNSKTSSCETMISPPTAEPYSIKEHIEPQSKIHESLISLSSPEMLQAQQEQDIPTNNLKVAPIETKYNSKCQPSPVGKTTLHLAAEEGHGAIVKCLLEFGAEIDAVDGSGSTALLNAVRSGCRDVVAMLLDKGASTTARDNEGWTAQHLAGINGFEDIIRLLIRKGVDLNAKVEAKGPFS
ncbi:Ankyrin repeat-containing protein [Glarea lozoyensis ATCC 20868]|uniref:Ankyrin repeat-containing protein n=1 Tax=Glarea lozoyensis (strain ATCC 20868 / MF5171) TaxID=1116229 RepID=S3CYL7_GLAL2|nr:Ankyrin repeat-containing protein [Glarea lozoyensis ATCC 20868]EPE30044.1 Ankyrin repeat-containing protein [Glarea lozoyensis ATCC 20868]